MDNWLLNVKVGHTKRFDCIIQAFCFLRTAGIFDFVFIFFLCQGVERFSSYSGYGKTFEFTGDFKDESEVGYR